VVILILLLLQLDNRIDKTYREKHFPAGFASTKGTTSSTGTAPAASHETGPAEGEPKPLTLEELIASFSSLKIEAAPPVIENTPPPPCPIASLPDELLVHILQDVAVADVGDFARLSLVCKHFAYLVATEQRPWKRICLGPEFGFISMPRHWQKSVEWEDLEAQEEADEDGLLVSMRELEERRLADDLSFTVSLHDPAVYPTWKHMFRHRPRVRFNGCYISTVNYVRSGQASTNQSTWGGAPVLIVTYYRYLRFLRDGTAISLLTTASPVDVVHHLTPELLQLHREAPHAHLPSAVMLQAHKGRWRQSSALDHPDNADPKEQEADVYVETEGVGSKYMYRMDLSLRSAGKGTKNNKIIWRSFYSHNKLTDDWAEFQLKNDKPFFFSRVKSYGVGLPSKEL
jgi:F-box protein 9